VSLTSNVNAGEADLMRSLANAFSYWQGQDIRNATATYFDDMMQAIGHIQEVSGSLDAIHVMTGETGWPTGRRLS
jgi:glucan 1,3-beta-glucosidase